MADHDEVMGALKRVEAQNAWLVDAVSYLLKADAGIEDEWVPSVPRHAVEPETEDWIAPRFAPRAPPVKACPHNQQVLVDGNIACARCGTVLNASGVAQNRVTNDGRIVADPNPPRWATEHSPGASSKNPGTPLVPYSD